jgi:hypothetical protein
MHQLKWLILCLVILVVIGTVAGCAPKTFVQSEGTVWKAVEFGPEVERDQVWYVVADTIADKYDIETIDKDSGYVSTACMSTPDERYRTKVIVKIPPGKEKVLIKATAHWYDSRSKTWITGYDSLLLKEILGEIQDKVGQVNR